MQESNFPISRSDFRLFDVKCAALIQVTEQAAVKFDGMDKMALDLREPILLFVNQNPTFHRMKDFGFVGRRMEIRVRLNQDFDQAVLTLSELRIECIRQHLEQILGLARVFLLSALLLFPIGGFLHQILNALVFLFLFFRGDWPSVYRR